MKELSIEEKAKAYDEALERAKELLEIGLKDTRDKRVVLSFFPELAESEDERIRKEIISMFETLDRKDWIAWLEKQGEQKPAEWSKEDEWCLEQINFLIRNSYSVDDKVERLSNWLKSLKDRVQPQPQQQWSEEDEDMRYKATAVINRLCADGKEYVWSISTLEKLFYWLKSLRPQSTWRPSEMEMKALEFCLEHNIDKDGVFGSKVVKLYDELKKLKG